MDIKDVFDAYPKSSWTVLCAPAVGFYIPPYQRFYSWDKSNIDRLFEDIAHGVNMLLDREDCISFIGTIIVIHDQKYETVAPALEGELPAKVLLVIDGQQRLSTLLMLNAVLHHEIEYRNRRLEKTEDPALSWIANESKKLLANLSSTFQQDMTYGEAVNQFYPRIIRAYDDCWSRKADDAVYASPVPRFLFDYIKYNLGEKKGKFTYNPDLEEKEQEKHKVVVTNLKQMKKLLQEIASEKAPWEFPTLSAISKSDTLQASLFNQKFSEDVRSFVSRDPEEQEEEKGRELLSLLVFARYVLDRAAVTEVTAKNEDYAFDMFEALNTTGEPLTAFETFRPRVVEKEGLAAFEKSDSRKHLEHVEAYLEKFSKAEARQKATSEILIPFALAESGKKLSKRLNDQRRFLRDSYNELEGVEERRSFTQNLGHIAMFVTTSWPDDGKEKPSISGKEAKVSDAAVLCLEILRSANHNITLSLMARFFSEWRIAKQLEADARYEELEQAIFAVTGFFALWRGSRRGTAGIDGCYREIMADGISEISIKGFCRKARIGDPISVKELRTALKHFLENDKNNSISSKEDWVAQAKELPLYKFSQPLVRVLLLAATDDTVADTDNPGLLKKGKDDSLPLFNQKEWSEKGLTVEHVAPGEPSGGWDTALYEDTESIHRIGNLALLPGPENSSIGNDAWDKKRLFYKLLAAQTQDEHADLIAEAEKEGLKLSEAQKDKLQEARHIPHVLAISRVGGDWDLEMIDKRGQRICELAYDKLAGWLDL